MVAIGRMGPNYSPPPPPASQRTVQRIATSCTVASSNINDLAIPQLDWTSALLDVVLAGVRRRGAILQSHGFGWLGAGRDRLRWDPKFSPSPPAPQPALAPCFPG